MPRRTDLALEAHEELTAHPGRATKIPGVRARSRRLEGCDMTRVDVLDQRGAQAMGKDVGCYITLDFAASQQQPDFFQRAVRAVGSSLRPLLPEQGSVLVAALGNPAMTPDAIGPLAAEHILVTRHLIASFPRQFGTLRPVAVQRAGVLGTTGIESAESIRAVVAQLKPAAVIAIDALAARRKTRLCTAVQLTDTGIVPGSGVGNHRSALNRETLGVPVIAAGVPTVVDAATLAADLLEDAGVQQVPQLDAGGLFVTPRDIDQRVRQMAQIVGYGINWALQELDIEEITALLG